MQGVIKFENRKGQWFAFWHTRFKSGAKKVVLLKIASSRYYLIKEVDEWLHEKHLTGQVEVKPFAH